MKMAHNTPLIDEFGQYSTHVVYFQKPLGKFDYYYLPDFDVDALRLKKNISIQERRQCLRKKILDLSMESLIETSDLPPHLSLPYVHKVYEPFVDNIEENTFLENVYIPDYWNITQKNGHDYLQKMAKETIKDITEDHRRCFWMIAYEIDDRPGSLNALEPAPFSMGDQGYDIYFPEFDMTDSNRDHREVFCSETELYGIAYEEGINRLRRYYSKHLCLPERKSRDDIIQECYQSFGQDFFDDDEDDVKMYPIELSFNDCMNAVQDITQKLSEIGRKNRPRPQ